MGAQSIIFVPLSKLTPQPHDRAVVLSVLAKGAVDPVRYHCAYSDGSSGDLYGLDDESGPVDHISLSRFGGRTMMERIFELADVLEVLLVWTDFLDDEPFACVTRAERLDAIAEETKPHLDLVVARDASHLNQLVKGSTFEENGW